MQGNFQGDVKTNLRKFNNTSKETDFFMWKHCNVTQLTVSRKRTTMETCVYVEVNLYILLFTVHDMYDINDALLLN